MLATRRPLALLRNCSIEVTCQGGIDDVDLRTAAYSRDVTIAQDVSIAAWRPTPESVAP
jgi:hypothetical protein